MWEECCLKIKREYSTIDKNLTRRNRSFPRTQNVGLVIRIYAINGDRNSGTDIGKCRRKILQIGPRVTAL